jgi:hypothetical protein
MTVYSAENIYKEAAFLAYYTHWSHSEIMSLPHIDRIRWCNEISQINSILNSDGNAPKNIFDV